ncbi:MAG TPA: hypothetical protein DEP42_06565 [Ruminococcaceae bacterium]|nr:hypothetical protein [Oscillospiraceae bacterium]
MLKKQIAIDFRNHFLFFIGLTVINVVLILLQLVPHMTMIGDYLYPFYQMIAFTLLILYIFISLYRDFYLGKDLLLLTIPLSESKSLFAKFIVYFSGFMLLWGSSLLAVFLLKTGLYATAIAHSQHIASGIAYLFVSRIAGALCGIGILFICLGIARLFRKRIISYFFILIVFVAIMIALGFLILNSNGCIHAGTQWSIGINTGAHVYNQYIGFIPVMIFPSKNTNDIATTINWLNVMQNALLACATYCLTYLLFKFKKYDYIQK